MSFFTAALLTVLLLAANAFFVGAEFALITSRRDRLEALVAQGKMRARAVIEASEDLSMMLAGAQFGITVCSLILGKVGEPAIAHLLEKPFQLAGLPDPLLHPVSFAVALLIVTILHILFGEMVPKNIAIVGPETVALALVPAHMMFVRVTRPLLHAMNTIARLTLKMFGIEQKDELDATVDQKQLATMIRESRSEGLLDAEEHTRLANALRSDNRTVREVLIPMEKAEVLHFGTQGPTLGSLVDAVNSTGFSRFPVMGKTSNPIGYVHIKDILDRVSSSTPRETVLPKASLRPLTTIELSTTMDEAVALMRRRRAHMAQVRDKGKLVGMLTLEDLIEEYVGTVRDWTHKAD
ncbi:hemolysin family protein [Corynebacterium epidermidicanis]|uniref:CBS domain-containing protein n=1 Tax=Corynebacterium epidermidicanis TaxID=1050174 RepID=A0A0G3GPD6_9CORY|nr:hemolysin family protein [Corynebacterium epidermidicanis]AKK03091.1 CBS domain-containing protein [Corynebacterium epidermidicanis]